MGIKITLNAGAILEFDSSSFAGTSEENYYLDLNSIDFECFGTLDHPCTIRSNASGDNGYIKCSYQPVGSTPTLSIVHTNFERVGTDTIGALQAHGNGETLIVQWCTFTDSSWIEREYGPSQNTETRIENNTWVDTVGDYCINSISTSFPLGTGVRTFTENTFDKQCVLNQVRGFSIRDNYFGAELPVLSKNLACVEFEGNILFNTDGAEARYLPGGAVDCIIIDQSGTNEFELVKASCGESTDVTIEGCIFMSDYDGEASDGKCITDFDTGPGNKVYIKNCITLPTASDDGVGAVTHAGGDAGTQLSFTHNTLYGSMFQFGNSYDGHTGILEILQSNLVHYPNAASGGSQFIAQDSAGTVEDYATATDLDYNNIYQGDAGSIGGGYDGWDFSAGSPGANDTSVDAQFNDSTRSIPSFYNTADGLNNSTPAAWATGQDYIEGDMVSSSTGGVWNADTIVYRCTNPHTSLTSDTSDGEPYTPSVTGWRGNWEFATYYELRLDPSKRARLRAWLEDGFVPQNAAVQNNGHDGNTRGAVYTANDMRLSPLLNEMMQGIMA